MGLIRDLDRLQPVFKDKVETLLKLLELHKINCFVNETLRTKEVQEAYYAQGRKPLDEVNILRKKAGLWIISEAENKNKITWTMKSKHLDGLAVDIVPINPVDKKLWWRAPDYIWKEIAELSQRCGLQPGYFWKEKDAAHHEEV